MRVAVASTNPVKIRAAEQAALAMFPESAIEAYGVDCTLDLPPQPMGQAQTRDCALRRAQFLQDRGECADLYIGMEGGVVHHKDALGRDQMYQIVWIVSLDKTGKMGEAHACGFALPPALRDRVLAGDELGVAADRVFSQVNSKQKTGTTGLLTGDVVTRLDLYVQPTILSLIPFRNPDLYR